MILVFTNKQDFHADQVIRRLHQKGVKVFRLNSEDLLTKYSIILSQKGDGWSGRILDEIGRSLALESLSVAWLRKPDFNFAMAGEVNTEAARFIASETKALINILYSLPNVTWINDPFNANKAKSKFQQLQYARRYHIKTPATLITTHSELAEEFFLEYNEDILVKSIYTGNITVEGVNQGITSVRIDKEKFYQYRDTIGLAPTQFQEYVEKDFELRITIFGNKVFAVRIDSQENEETKVDWRLNIRLNPHSIFELPNRIRDFCVDFIRDQGLMYGAMDFIVTPAGEYIFLENNPFGQYLWLESETNLPLSEEMCNLLLLNLRST